MPVFANLSDASILRAAPILQFCRSAIIIATARELAMRRIPEAEAQAAQAAGDSGGCLI